MPARARRRAAMRAAPGPVGPLRVFRVDDRFGNGVFRLVSRDAPDYPAWVRRGLSRAGWSEVVDPVVTSVEGPDWIEVSQTLAAALRSGDEGAMEAALEQYRDAVRAEEELRDRIEPNEAGRRNRAGREARARADRVEGEDDGGE